MLRERRAAAPAPGHRARPSVGPAVLVALLEEMPDVLGIGVRHRVIRVVPVHPLPEPGRLAAYLVGELRHALAAGAGEAVQPERLDVALRVELEVLLYLHLDPQPVAVEPVLVALVEALQRLVTLVNVLVGTPPAVMHAHGIVRRDRPIYERPVRV